MTADDFRAYGTTTNDTPAQRRAAAITCADHATSRTDLRHLLTALGLNGTDEPATDAPTRRARPHIYSTKGGAL